MRTPTFLGLPRYAPNGVGALRGDQSFPDAARTALGNGQLRRNPSHATATIRAKRAAVRRRTARLGGAAARRRGYQGGHHGQPVRSTWSGWKRR